MRLYLLSIHIFTMCIGLLQLAKAQPFHEKATESLKYIFGDSVSIMKTTVTLSKIDQQVIFSASKSLWNADTVTVFLCKSSQQTIGYGVLDHVKGKVQYITYLTVISAAGEIKNVDVLAYREAYGNEITYESFKKQFRGKTATDKLTPGKDIKNISGATISVRAITDGVKRILATFPLIRERTR